LTAQDKNGWQSADVRPAGILFQPPAAGSALQFLERDPSIYIFALTGNRPAGEQEFPQVFRRGKPRVMIWAAHKRLPILQKVFRRAEKPRSITRSAR